LTDAASPAKAENPVKELSVQVPPTHRSHRDRSSVSTAFFYPSLKALMERNACFQGLHLHIAQSPQYRSSPSRLPSQSSHRDRRRSVSTAFFTCLKKYLVKEPSLQVPRRDRKKRDASFQKLRLSESLVEEPSKYLHVS
jgi:hypothetical protein